MSPTNALSSLSLPARHAHRTLRRYSTFPDLNRPFSRESLDKLKALLDAPLSPSVSWHPAADCYVPPVIPTTGDIASRPRSSPAKPSQPYTYDRHNPQHAAVLIALANVTHPSRTEILPSILLEVRSNKMRSHAGEVSFAGGKMDKADRSLLDAAIRETTEELGVKAEQIEYLGRFAEPEVSYKGLVVWPFLAFIHAQDLAMTGNLPPLDMRGLRLSPDEVQSVIALPLPDLERLAHPSSNTDGLLTVDRQLFRHRIPYDVIDVSHMPAIRSKSAESLPTDGQPSEWTTSLVSKRFAKIQIWGLTGWFLDVLLRRAGIWRQAEQRCSTASETPDGCKSSL